MITSICGMNDWLTSHAYHIFVERGVFRWIWNKNWVWLEEWGYQSLLTSYRLLFLRNPFVASPSSWLTSSSTNVSYLYLTEFFLFESLWLLYPYHSLSWVEVDASLLIFKWKIFHPIMWLDLKPKWFIQKVKK